MGRLGKTGTVRVMVDFSYEASDKTMGLPVGPAELDAIIGAGARPLGRDPKKMVHLLRRVKDTMEAQSQDLTSMRKTVDELSLDRARVGTPTTLNPLDALKFASPEEIETIVDRISRQRLVMLRGMVKDAQDRRDDLVFMLEEVQRTLQEALMDPELTPQVRQSIQSVLEDLPAEVPEVHSPRMLEMPDDLGDVPTKDEVRAPVRRTGTTPRQAESVDEVKNVLDAFKNNPLLVVQPEVEPAPSVKPIEDTVVNGIDEEGPRPVMPPVFGPPPTFEPPTFKETSSIEKETVKKKEVDTHFTEPTAEVTRDPEESPTVSAAFPPAESPFQAFEQPEREVISDVAELEDEVMPPPSTPSLNLPPIDDFEENSTNRGEDTPSPGGWGTSFTPHELSSQPEVGQGGGENADLSDLFQDDEDTFEHNWIEPQPQQTISAWDQPVQSSPTSQPGQPAVDLSDLFDEDEPQGGPQDAQIFGGQSAQVEPWQTPQRPSGTPDGPFPRYQPAEETSGGLDDLFDDVSPQIISTPKSYEAPPQPLASSPLLPPQPTGGNPFQTPEANPFKTQENPDGGSLEDLFADDQES